MGTEISDIVNDSPSKLEMITNYVKENYVEIGIAGLSLTAAAVLAGKSYHGANTEHYNAVQNFFLTNATPHLIFGQFPIINSMYLSAKYSFNRRAAIAAGYIATIPIFFRDYLQYSEKAKDSIGDMIVTSIGIVIGTVLAHSVYKYTKNKIKK